MTKTAGSLTEVLDALVKLRTAQLAAELDGSLHGCLNNEIEGQLKIEVYGLCRKVHPDLKDKYPNGWSLSQADTVDEVLNKLGLKLAIADAQSEASNQKNTQLSMTDSLPHKSEYKDRYCLEYAIALLIDHNRKGDIGVTVEVGFGDKDDKIVLIHAVVHTTGFGLVSRTLGEDDSTGNHKRGHLKSLCIQWSDEERINSKIDGYSIESFCTTEEVRERAFALGIPIDQFAVMTAGLEIRKQCIESLNNAPSE